MSGKYVSAPPTSAQVLLVTTHGEILIELWAKETPKTCRNFIQLCLESYYDNTPFHRIVPGFIVQGGDPTGEGTGGESIYGGAFADETHSRLKFTHRGIVAMASSKPNDNRSQFFITLGQAPWLDHKHTIFGKVAGNSIFNAIKLSEVELDAANRPLQLPRVLRTEVLQNPFIDIIPRELTRPSANVAVVSRVQVFSKPVLHYSSDEEDEPAGIKSSHDLLDDPLLSKEVIVHSRPPSKLDVTKARVKQAVVMPVESDSDDPDFDLQMKEGVLARSKTEAFVEPMEISSYTVSQSNDRIKLQKNKNPEEEFKQLKYDLLQLKRFQTGTANEQVTHEAKAQEALMTPLELRRNKFSKTVAKSRGRESTTLKRLGSFMSSLKSHKKAAEEQTEEERTLWFNNRLKFSVDSSRAYSFKAKATEEPAEPDIAKRLKRYEEDHDVYGTKSMEGLLSDANMAELTKTP